MIYFCLIPPRIPEEKDLDRQTYREQTVPFYFFVERSPKNKNFLLCTTEFNSGENIGIFESQMFMGDGGHLTTGEPAAPLSSENNFYLL